MVTITNGVNINRSPEDVFTFVTNPAATPRRILRALQPGPKKENRMSTDQNKAVVRRFVTEVLAGGNIDVADDLLAPNYQNRATKTDLPAFKEMLTGMNAAIPDRRFDIEELVAEGDAVVARFSYEMADTTGQKISARGLTYYGLADGKIVEDDPMSTPDLMQELGKLMPMPASG
jgi:predicted ester cyclase